MAEHFVLILGGETVPTTEAFTSVKLYSADGIEMAGHSAVNVERDSAQSLLMCSGTQSSLNQKSNTSKMSFKCKASWL